ncbi:hypothetical protein EUX98_g5549 [Antrodiella citrinella]|uniref:NAD-dependent epimerase/dehydratase domain-containing protein n=1 Tax=Antrodiella citrinella TaxID=2447956 RepID=A0A4S4MR66_9APHY|nr:hypothetical protein EUX98_g5549 [Antrodiella citrinella]
MPAIKTGKVLVTGANGYVAVWIVKKLLEEGFSVRGTVRSESKAPYLKNLFASYGDKLEFVVVSDITKDGAFDEAVKGVDAIQHTASPFHLNGSHPDDMVVPAVAGTQSILQSTLKHGTNVKRVVLTSSCAAVEELHDDPRVFTEEMWNKQSIDEIEQKGSKSSPSHWYRASKTLAEKAAWDFVKDHKSEISWDLVAMNPPYVYGPVLQELDGVASLNLSMWLWYKYVLKGGADLKELVTVGGNGVDVRDCANAHVRSMTVEEAGGHRILTSGGVYRWQDWVNAARKIQPDLPEGDTSFDSASIVHPIVFHTDKFEKILGLKYHTKEETSHAILENFKERGLWDGKAPKS